MPKSKTKPLDLDALINAHGGYQSTIGKLPPPSGDIEKDSQQEVAATREEFAKSEYWKKEKAGMKARMENTQNLTDSEYWFAVCFQNREQKVAFLKAVKWFEEGDKYLDGAFVAAQMGVELPVVKLRYDTQRMSEKLVAACGVI